MFRLFRTILFALLAAVALFAGYYAAVERTADGDPEVFPDLVLPDESGVERRLSELGGELTLVNFWATWCAPCRDEIPLLIDVQQRHGQQGLRVIGIALDDPEKVMLFAGELGMNYPNLIADASLTGSLARFNSSGGIPFTVLLDAGFRVLERKIGVLEHAELETLVKRHLGARMEQPRDGHDERSKGLIAAKSG